MNLRIEINDAPSFNEELEITIRLKKDGVIETEFTRPVSTPSSLGDSSETKDQERKVKSKIVEDNISMDVDESRSKNGSKNAKVESFLSSTTSPETAESTNNESKPKTSRGKRGGDSGAKLSGNLMGMEF